MLCRLGVQLSIERRASFLRLGYILIVRRLQLAQHLLHLTDGRGDMITRDHQRAQAFLAPQRPRLRVAHARPKAALRRACQRARMREAASALAWSVHPTVLRLEGPLLAL